MKRKLSVSPRFKKKLEKFLDKHPDFESRVEYVLQLLQNDPFALALETHRLHGVLVDFYACKINYHYRLVFLFDDWYIYPHSIGTHDEV